MTTIYFVQRIEIEIQKIMFIHYCKNSSTKYSLGKVFYFKMYFIDKTTFLSLPLDIIVNVILKWGLHRFNFCRYGARMGGIPDLLVKLKDVPDFYVDMTWEFTSWLPLVSRLVVLVFFLIRLQRCHCRMFFLWKGSLFQESLYLSYIGQSL